MMKFTIRTIPILLLLGILPAGCGSISTSLAGLHRIKTLGYPPIDYVIWSPTNPEQVLITAGNLMPGDSEIQILDVSTKKKTVLAQTEHGNFEAITWLPDGKSVLFFVSPGTQGYESGVWEADVTGESIKFLGDQAPDSLSPDGTKSIIFEQEGILGAAKSQLHLINVESLLDEVIYIAKSGERFYGLSWSPDSRYIVFSVGDDTTHKLYVMNLESRHLTQITEGKVDDAPVWSPSKDIIAFQRLTEDRLHGTIHLIKPDGTCDIEIPKLKDVRSPTWSSDGQKLGFVGSGGLYYLGFREFLATSELENACFQIQ